MRGWRRWRTRVLLGMAVLAGAAAAEGVRAVGPSPAGAGVDVAADDPAVRVDQEASARMEAAALLVRHAATPSCGRWRGT